jgi:hypothetical protein
MKYGSRVIYYAASNFEDKIDSVLVNKNWAWRKMMQQSGLLPFLVASLVHVMSLGLKNWRFHGVACFGLTLVFLGMHLWDGWL